MGAEMTSHMIQELLKTQISSEGFKVLTGMGLKFTKDQIDILSRYLDTIIVEQTTKIEESNDDIVINNNKILDHINVLMETIVGLTLISFINFGVTVYHKSK